MDNEFIKFKYCDRCKQLSPFTNPKTKECEFYINEIIPTTFGHHHQEEKISLKQPNQQQTMSSPSNLTIPSTSTTNDNTKAQKRVAIIGAGWYGCHLGLVLKNKGYKVTIFEKENDIFLGASGYNQFRLHKGLHYARSYITRVQALKGFDHFMKTYPELTTQADYNLYGIATKNSWLDFGTYKQ